MDIFDFNFSLGDYLSNHAICDVKKGERIIKNMDIYFIELPKFRKQSYKLNNVTDKWIYFIKEAENLDVIPDNIEDNELKEAYLYAIDRRIRSLRECENKKEEEGLQRQLELLLKKEI